MTTQPAVTGAKVLLIGLDGADRELVMAWADEGRLPTLQRLCRAGVSGTLTAPSGLGDDAAWASFSTGLAPGRHGRVYHRRVRVAPDDLVNHRRDAISQPPFWERLAEQGLQVAAIDVPKSPIGGAHDSMVVADWMCHGNDGSVVALSPWARVHPLAGRFVPDPTFICDALHRDDTETRCFERRLRERAAVRSEALLELLGSQRWDLFLAVFAETHCVGHQCWHDHDPAHPNHDPARADSVGDVIEHIYRDVDARLDELIDQAGQDAIVIVFSLLGMGPNYSGEHLLDTVLERLESGSVARTPTTRRLISGLRRRTPRLFRRVVPRTLRRASRRASTGAHQYWVLPTDLPATAIRINLVGREPWGVVRPGPEFKAVCDDLRRELLTLRDPSTNLRLVHEVVLTREAHPSTEFDPFADLIVVWEQTSPITAAMSPKVGIVRGAPPDARSGNHRNGGWFVATGPGISPQRLERRASVLDLAPTVARLLGASPDEADGAPVTALDSQGLDLTKGPLAASLD